MEEKEVFILKWEGGGKRFSLGLVTSIYFNQQTTFGFQVDVTEWKK